MGEKYRLHYSQGGVDFDRWRWHSSVQSRLKLRSRSGPRRSPGNLKWSSSISWVFKVHRCCWNFVFSRETFPINTGAKESYKLTWNVNIVKVVGNVDSLKIQVKSPLGGFDCHKWNQVCHRKSTCNKEKTHMFGVGTECKMILTTVKRKTYKFTLRIVIIIVKR